MDWVKVETFWVCYCHLARPSTLPSPTDLHLFKDGIRPLWEVCVASNFIFEWKYSPLLNDLLSFYQDSANCNGGKWIIRFKKVVSGRFWEDLVWPLNT